MYQIFCNTLLQVYRVRCSGEPKYLFNLLGKDTRNGRIPTPFPNLLVVRDSFTYRGAQLWNSLPVGIRNTKKISSFKRIVKKWIRENVPRFPE